MIKGLFLILFFLHFNIIKASLKCDTLFIENDTIVLNFNNWGEPIDIHNFLNETERIAEGNIYLDSLEVDDIIHITRLYNTAAFCGVQFFRFNLKFIVFYDENLIDTFVKKLEAVPSGSPYYSEKYNIYIGGNIFYHENSRYKIVCDTKVDEDG